MAKKTAEALKNAATVKALSRRSGVALCVHGINKKFCQSCLNSKKPSVGRKSALAVGAGSDPKTE